MSTFLSNFLLIKNRERETIKLKIKNRFENIQVCGIKNSKKYLFINL